MGKNKTVRVKGDSREDFSLTENAPIDLSCFDWGSDRLTERQKLFIIWFCFPHQEAYHCQLKAARKAGYTARSAQTNAYQMRRDPRINKLIKKFECDIGGVNLLDTVQRWLSEKIVRGNYNVKDFYEVQEYIDKNGTPRKQFTLKPFDKLTLEQQLCIDGIDFKGQKGIPIYLLPDREKVRDSLIAIVQKQQIGNEDADDEDETMEIIMERLTMKKALRKEKDEISQMAGILRLPKGEAITEL